MPGPSPFTARGVLVVDALYLAGLLGYVGWTMWPALFRTWFFSSDEYVIGAEVIRFLHLDFRQQYFDMPGTPLMIITALLWAGHFLTQVLAGGVPFDIERFTFQHIEAFFVLMRGLTLLFFGLSIVLLYVLAARLTNRFGAWAAALILATSPIYTSYSSFVRVESLSMCFMLGSLLCLVSWTPPPRLLWASGVLAGLAAASRFHAMTAILPLLLLFVACRTREPEEDYPGWAKRVLVGAGVVTVIANLLFLVRPRGFPQATALLGTAIRLALVGLAVMAAAYFLTSTRRLLVRLVPADTIRLVSGFVLGILAGTPTILWRFYPSFLQSMEMYRSTYLDFDRASWPFWQNLTWYVSFYFKEAAPGVVLPVLLVAGAVLALLLRRVEIIWILAGAALFFASKPINLKAAPHHIILWLPFYAIVAAYPVAVGWHVVGRWPRPARLAGGAVLAAGLVYLAVSSSPAAGTVTRDLQLTEERLRNVRQATTWVKDHADRNANVLVAYFSFNADIAYAWFRAMDVPVPEPLKDGRTWVIWWGHQRAFEGRSGYALATRSDVGYLKTGLDQVEPGQGTDPYSDPRFTLAQSFGDIPTRVDVFRFTALAEPTTPAVKP